MRNTNNIEWLIFICVLILACQPQPYRQGLALYQVHCEQCHMKDGSGLRGLIPSLASSTTIVDSPAGLVCLIRKGLTRNPATGQEMPGNQLLNEVEIANLTNYLRSLYTIDKNAIKVADVANWLKSCD